LERTALEVTNGVNCVDGIPSESGGHDNAIQTLVARSAKLRTGLAILNVGAIVKPRGAVGIASSVDDILRESGR
jgi:hypothetical protein